VPKVSPETAGSPGVASGAGRPSWVGRAERSFFGAGLLLVGAWGSAQFDSLAYQARGAAWLSQAIARAESGSDRSRGTSDARRRGDGELIGRIEIPRIGISAMIANGCESETLRRAVGHLPNSAFPGEVGNVCLAAHRDSFFRRPREIEPGDVVRITTPEGEFEYDVSSIAVMDPSGTKVLAPTRSPTLTLVTCYTFHFVGPAPERFVVRARHVRTFAPDQAASGFSSFSSPPRAPGSSALYSRSRL